MTTCGQKYRCIDNCYCGNDNDNKILVPPVFGMTMLTTVITLITKKVIVMVTEKSRDRYCCTPHIQSQLLISYHTSPSTIEG
jgi:hypothetical protein